jgi:hypothetical protein
MLLKNAGLILFAKVISIIAIIAGITPMIVSMGVDFIISLLMGYNNVENNIYFGLWQPILNEYFIDWLNYIWGEKSFFKSDTLNKFLK